jgi:hypothetical protein
MPVLPIYIKVVFVLTTIATITIFYFAGKRMMIATITLIAWCFLQVIIGSSGFYLETAAMPPRFIFLVGPPLLVIVILFSIRKGKEFIDGLDPKVLTLLHTVRIPVEIVLYWLFVHGAVPELMTFEGRNFDILSGLTAPFVYYLGFVKKDLSGKAIAVWNFICLALLINIVTNAILSVPTPFQKFAFDQPNVGVLSVPFNLLPACIVPLVLFSHLVVIRQLISNKQM